MWSETTRSYIVNGQALTHSAGMPAASEPMPSAYFIDKEKPNEPKY